MNRFMAFYSQHLRKSHFIERTIRGLNAAIEHIAHVEDSSGSPGLLQRLDPRVKLCGALLLICATVVSSRLAVAATILAMASLVVVFSGGMTLRIVAKLWGAVLLLTGAIALPAVFITHGEPVWRMPWVGWIATAQGLRSALLLVVRAETTATLAMLLALSTRWMHLLKALRILRVPLAFVMIVGMTHRYICLLLETSIAYFEARRTRLIGKANWKRRRQMAISTAGVLLEKSIQTSSEVYAAMQARGFRGEMRTLDEFRMRPLDRLALALFAGIAAAAFFLGTL